MQGAAISAKAGKVPQSRDVQLMVARFVAPNRKNNKDDGTDAETVSEAVGRRACTSCL